MANRRAKLRERYKIAGIIVGVLVWLACIGVFAYAMEHYHITSPLLLIGVVIVGLGVTFGGLAVGALIALVVWATGQAIYPKNKDAEHDKRPEVFD